MLTFLMLMAIAQAPEPARMAIVFGGDVIPHGPVKYVARMHDRRDEDRVSLNSGGWDHVFGPLAGVFKRHDVAIVNLEAPVTTHPTSTDPNAFSAQPPLLWGLKRAGVTVATFANNHSLDQDTKGITSTRKAIDEAELLCAGADVNEGAAWTPLLIERKGFRIAFIAVTRWLNTHNNSTDRKLPHVPAIPYPSDPITGGRSAKALVDLVQKTAATVDAVFVSVHWGIEYADRPLLSDRNLAKRLIEAGAAAVIGHHPHVLQPVEWVERSDGSRGLVAFSLGNLVSNQDFDDATGRKRDGVLLELVLERNPEGRTEVSSVEGVAIATENRLGSGKTRNVQPVLLDEEVAAVEERIDVLAQRDDRESKDERQSLSKRLALLKKRLARIGTIIAPAAVVAKRSQVPTHP